MHSKFTLTIIQVLVSALLLWTPAWLIWNHILVGAFDLPELSFVASCGLLIYIWLAKQGLIDLTVVSNHQDGGEAYPTSRGLSFRSDEPSSRDRDSSLQQSSGDRDERTKLKDMKKEVVLGGTGQWVFTSSMDEALDHMRKVLDKVRANTVKARASQPTRR